jgi:8-oxo-dGTP diphosphatase
VLLNDSQLQGSEPGCLGIETRRPARPLPIVLVAAVALVDVDSRVLVQQRPEHKSWAGWWEFPGGKVHEGETPEATIVRELKEELDLDITESCLAPFTFASHAYDDCQLLMPLYLCRVWKGTPAPREGQTLKWIRPMDLGRLPQLLPADVPLVAMLRDWL